MSLEDKENQDIVTFLKNSFPDKVRYFYFNTSANNIIKLDSYMESVNKCLLSTTREICIGCCKISSTYLNEIIKHSYNCKRLILPHVIIQYDLPYNFEIDSKYRTDYISFEGSGQPDRSNWDLAHFKLILQAMVNSGLKMSLKTLHIKDCQIEIDEVQTLMDSLLMNHIEVSDIYINHQF